MTTVTSELLNRRVQFRSISDKDATLWDGVITAAAVSHTVARGFGDIVQYHAGAERARPSIGSVESLTYFLIALDSGPPRPFAEEWILSGSFKVMADEVAVKITVWDVPVSDHSAILTLLQSGGYRATITGVEV